MVILPTPSEMAQMFIRSISDYRRQKQNTQASHVQGAPPVKKQLPTEIDKGLGPTLRSATSPLQAEKPYAA